MSDFDVSRNEEEGGWFGISVYKVADIVSCPGFLTNKNSSAVVFAATNEVIDIVPIAENIRISEPSKKTKNGTHYSISIGFDVFLQNELMDDYLNSYLHSEVVVVAEKHNKEKKLYGSKKFPLDFEYAAINGTKAEDGNQFRITIRANIPQKPVYMNG